MLNYIIWILFTILYSPVFYQLYTSRWDIVDYGHAYFILPISLYLVWQKRDQLKQIYKEQSPSTNLYAFILFTISIMLFIFGWRRDFLVITSISLIPALFTLVIFIYGKDVAKALSFPIFYLLLLVPPPLSILDSITLPMRYGISVATQIILNFFNYPITREGLLLLIGGHQIYMGAPCSGFRSLITIISLGLVYAYINKGTIKKKIILIIAVIPLALLGNLIRVMSMCLFTFYFGENIAQQYFHDYSGIVMFILVTLGLMGMESLLDKIMLSDEMSRGKE
ncbi:exosortase [Candidatus Poribacteria bacterium]|nr:exosortase [Candidatus Poribacteria bacterium]